MWEVMFRSLWCRVGLHLEMGMVCGARIEVSNGVDSNYGGFRREADFYRRLVELEKNY